ncbi:glycosyltransferase family 2 protein [Cohnella thailandensis]|uniref:Glycosyltransferase family 2 protein n=1 Tax=Cohnella thailandensis TaxID=557557 RepID=A0A841SRN8_9BACL|nr:glycosyltransferase family 2 protein [Cohnella thailandensis]MBB6634604.1 glycosyltransferase family 2 protein [Cohnella thailandensis]MBP1972840.1 glycosyltransferase involved in cell wall biosynthesis [Cohnella thailandensis]
MKELSVVVPLYNERDDLMRLYFAITGALDPFIGEYEIILVNDGSTDGSETLLDRIAENDPRVRVIPFQRNYGQTAAISAGLKMAEGCFIALMDGDLQTYPEDILKLLPYMQEFDFANGTRVERKDTLLKKISSRIGNGVRNRVTGDRVQDTGCPMKVFKSDVAQSFNLYEGFHRFLPTLARMNGFRVVEVPVGHRERTAGHSKYGVLNRAFVGLMDAIVIGWLRKRTINYRIRGN